MGDDLKIEYFLSRISLDARLKRMKISEITH